MGISQAITALRDLLGDRLSTAEAVRAEAGQSESHMPSVLPDAVAFPESTKEVSAILRICHGAACPVVARGTGTSLEGHHLAVRGGICLNMMRMDKVLEVRAEDLNAVVQPGVSRESLNTELRATGLFFPVDPGANASLGGMASTRASGTTAVRYGTMAENILALEAVLADGTIIRTGTAARKSSAGYDLTRLLIGAEGTLGIITELTVKLQGIPEAVSAATCRFGSVADAVDCVIATIQCGVPMARIELVDETMARGFRLYSGRDLPEQPHLFLEFHGSAAGVREQAELFGDIAGEYGAEGFEWTDQAEARNALWSMRHNAYYAMKALAPEMSVLTTDVCVPISRLAEAVERAQSGLADLGLVAAIVGHVGDGNFHCGVMVDGDDTAQVARVRDFVADLAQLALDCGGTISGEHGIGAGKMKFMEAQHGAALAPMRAIKAALDPLNILNPGKILPEIDETKLEATA